MNEDKDEIEFSYEVFDRQLDNFCRMLSILGRMSWEDYSPQELTFDIRSTLHQSHPALLYGRERYGAATQRHSQAAKRAERSP